MTFTATDVINAFESDQFESYSEWRANRYPESEGWSTVDGWYELGDGAGRVTLDGTEYTWESVEHIGGGEGSGEYTAVVFRLDNRLFRKEGYYASHYGTEWDGDFEEVEAYEKTVTDYRAV